MLEYLIPKNVRTRTELFPDKGIGYLELGIIVGFLVVGYLLQSAISIFYENTIVNILIVVVFFGIGCLLVIKEERTGINALQFLTGLKKWLRNPKSYPYIFGTGRKEEDNFD